MLSLYMKHFGKTVINNREHSFHGMLNMFRYMTQLATETEMIKKSSFLQRFERFEKNNENVNENSNLKNIKLSDKDELKANITRYFGLKTTEEVAIIQDVFKKINERFD
jgi:hypothetical protein